MGKPCVVWRPGLRSSWDLRPVRSRSHHHMAVAAPICLDPEGRHVALCSHRLWEEVEQGLRKWVEWVSAEAQCPALPTGGCSGEPPAGQEVKRGQSSG